VGGQDLAGVEGDDGHLDLVDDGQHATPGVGGTDLEVMQAARPAQGDPTGAVGRVIAQPEVARGGAAGRLRLGQRAIRLGRRRAPDRPARPLSTPASAYPASAIRTIAVSVADVLTSRCGTVPA
jgi:hypothetical protein